MNNQVSEYLSSESVLNKITISSLSVHQKKPTSWNRFPLVAFDTHLIGTYIREIHDHRGAACFLVAPAVESLYGESCWQRTSFPTHIPPPPPSIF